MGEILRPVWIDPSWLSWEGYDEGSRYLQDGTAARPYEIHQHACDRLADNPNEFDRVDAITTLRRSVGHRVKALKEIYRLRELRIGAKPKGDLELLSSLGIIRPFMLKRLIDIRNIVEHQDSRPPSVDECLMFADLVWYFLRSTDKLVYLQLERLTFVPPGEDFFSRDYHPTLTLDFSGPFGEPPEVEAWLNPPGFTYEPRADWIRVESSEMTKYDDLEPCRVAIKCKVTGTDEQMKHLYEIYFRISHFKRVPVACLGAKWTTPHE